MYMIFYDAIYVNAYDILRQKFRNHTINSNVSVRIPYLFAHGKHAASAL
jgi:hypothetical protein